MSLLPRNIEVSVDKSRYHCFFSDIMSSIASDSNDSLKIEEFNQFLNNTSKTKEGYNSAFIYVLNKLYINNDMDMVKDMLENNSFDSNDNMFNAYYYKMKSEVLYSGDFKNSTKFLIKAIDTVESFDLKVSYCEELVDLYIANSMLDKASKDVIGPRQLVRQKEWLEPAYKQVEAAFILKLEAEWDAAVGIAMTEKDIAETHGVRKFFPFSIPQIKNS